MYTSPWAWEIAALIGVSVSFAGLVTLLAAFDGQNIYKWTSIYGGSADSYNSGNSVTLNTAVSALSLVLRALLLYPIAECIGQWKWILFDRSERSLMDFERIDLASRGPLGSLYLSWKKDVPWILRLGAIVAVLTLAVDPFSQQLVQLEERMDYTRKTAEMPRAHSYKRGHLFQINETESANGSSNHNVLLMGAQPDISMEAAILSGLSRSTVDFTTAINSFCSSGDCKWEPFETLGVCARCRQLSSEIKRVADFGDVLKHMGDFDNYDVEIHKENATAVELPNGHFLPNLNGCLTEHASDKGCEWPVDGADPIRVPAYTATSFRTSNPNETVSMQDLDTMIWSETELRLDEDQRKSGHLSQSDLTDDPIEWLPPQYNATDPIRLDPDSDLSTWPETPIQASECALYYCVQNVSVWYEGNRYDEFVGYPTNVVRKPESWKPLSEENYAPENISPNLDSLEFHEKYAALEMTDLVLHYLNRSAEQSEFTIIHEAVRSISAYFQNTVQNVWGNQSEALELIRERVPDALALPNGRVMHNPRDPRARNISQGEHRQKVMGMSSFRDVALSMTIEIRNNGGENLDGESDNRQLGFEGHQRTFYRAEWAWISLHGVILFFGVLFCVLTMFSARRDSKERLIWKNHSLATMRQGAVAAQRLGRVTTIRDLEKRASKERVTMPWIESAKAPSPSTSEDNIDNNAGEAEPLRS